MKNIIFGIASFLVCLLLILCIYTVQGKDTRKTEAYESLEASLKTAGEQVKEETYDSDDELKAAFIEYVLAQTDSTSDVQLTVLKADCKKGIISAEIVTTYTHPNGEEGTVSCKKTMIFDKKEETEETAKNYQINFYNSSEIKVENLYKSYTLKEGEALKEPVIPKDSKNRVFVEWKDAATNENVNLTEPASKDLNIYAVWKDA